MGENLKEIKRALIDFRTYRMEHGGMEGDVSFLYDALIHLIGVLEKGGSMRDEF